MTLTMMLVLAPLLLVGVVGAGLGIFTYRTAKRVEHGLPAAGRQVEVPGGAIHVHEQGAGPALLLIHGLGGQMLNFHCGVVERLAEQFRVVSVDRPGSGYSVRAASTPADLSTQAAALAALIDKLQLGRPVVVGHSLGGALALTLAIEHPRCVAGLVLVAPLTHLQEGVPAAFRGLMIRAPWLRKLVAWTIATPASIVGRNAVLEQVFGPDPVPREFATRGGGLLSLRPSQFLAASADIQALPDSLPRIEARYGELKVPVSILFGRDDRILDWRENGEAFVRKVPGATLQLTDGGHMLPVTNPALTARFISQAAESQLPLNSSAAASGLAN
jgi:pimeloyl-ACP methyl ester carboxylesterase